MSLPKLTFLRAVVILEVLLLIVWVELYALGGPPPFVRTAGIALSTLTITFILLMLCTKGCHLRLTLSMSRSKARSTIHRINTRLMNCQSSTVARARSLSASASSIEQG